MAKNKKKNDSGEKSAQDGGPEDDGQTKLKGKAYLKELRKLQVQLCALQA